MSILRRHKALLGLSVLAVLLLISAFSSPYWFRLHYLSSGRGDHGWQDHLSGDGPIAMAKRESEPRPRHPDDTFVTVSAGLWYFITCVDNVKFTEEGARNLHKCHFSTYCHASHAADHLPEEMRGVGLESIYTNIGEFSQFGLLEFQVEATIGMVCAIVGMIAGFRYVCGHFTKRGTGLLTFIFHIVPGVLFAVIFGKAITMYKMCMMALTQLFGYHTDSPFLYIAIPYSLLVVSGASIIILGISLVFLIILSKGPRKHIDVIRAQGIAPGVPFGMISPPGYQPFLGLSDRPSSKEGEQLTEKVPL
ncbi:uncharacterized protein LOC117329151 [Pecten maximus]|uniref:uncharacterized protein LOC117329151 n=1 Tax=Pecten maximus TaxID=6579 RepID=UPI0014585D4F|nr:uncharacterized protein LOC117329151 [Pecten maximus]